jgi:hypothetical protein
MMGKLMLVTIVILLITISRGFFRSPRALTRRSGPRSVKLAGTTERGDETDPTNEFSMSKGIIPTGKDLQSSSSDVLPGASSLAKFSAASSGGSNTAGPLSFDRKPPSAKSRRYVQMVSELTPNEMLMKFAQKSPKNVQEAAKTTVMSILGQLPNYALDAALITTSSKLANLAYQMQLTGYMLKNAEYRMSLTRSLKGLPRLPESTMLTQGNFSAAAREVGSDGKLTVSGEVTVTDKSTGEQATFDANELTSSLSKEVDALRSELALIRGEREKELQSNLLTYVQALPENELVKLSSGMGDDVMEAFGMLVDALFDKLSISREGPEVAVQQSMGAMAQLCMWQLTVGYRLRELESFDTGVSFEEDT